MGKVAIRRNSYGDLMWTALLAVVPEVTDTNIYLHRVSADEYEVFRKIHATGPYWCKWVYTRVPEAGLEPTGCYTGIPDPGNDIPSTWTTDPATRLLVSTTEYVWYGTEEGSVEEDWGSGHNTNEQLASESWAVDGVPVSLANDAWVNGSSITYTAATYYIEPYTGHRVCDLTKVHTYDKSLMWVDRAYTYTWHYNWVPKSDAQFALMASVNTTNLSTFTFRPGGLDIPTTGGTTNSDVISHAGAAWCPTNGAILGMFIDFVAGLLSLTTGRCYVNGGMEKIYFIRSAPADGAQAGAVWHFHSRYLALDNCGNHFLKTT